MDCKVDLAHRQPGARARSLNREPAHDVSGRRNRSCVAARIATSSVPEVLGKSVIMNPLVGRGRARAGASAIVNRALRATLLLAAGLTCGCASVSRSWGPGATVLDVRRPPEPEYLGMYLAGEKVGETESSLTVEERDGVPVLVRRRVSTVAASVGSKLARATSRDEKVYEARPGGRLLAFSLLQRTVGGSTLAVQGRCRADGCEASVEAGGRREQRRLRRVNELTEMADPERLSAARCADVSGRELVLETLSVVETRTHCVGKDRIRDGADYVDVFVVEQVSGSDRQSVRHFFAPDGHLVQSRFGQVVMRAEPRDNAVLLTGSVNLAKLTRVSLPAELSRTIPDQVTFRMRGVPERFQLTDARQIWRQHPDGSTLVTVSARIPAASRDDPPRGRGVTPGEEHLLASTVTIDSDAPSIQAAAREMTAGVPGIYAATLAIMRRLSERMAAGSVAYTHCASEALGRPEGTSEERARLFTALARAAGVPARDVHGLVYERFADGVPALYWRSWVEVKAREEWIAVDPELGESVADATHIKFGVGDSTDSTALFGEIEVLSASSDGER